MILPFCLLALLVATNTGAQRIKGGGGRIIQQPAFLGGSSLGPSSAQFSVDDAQIRSFGQRRLYRTGLSQVPYGLSGLDYYSYPNSLLTSGRNLGGKNIFADNLSGLSPVGGRRTTIIADPSTSQFSVGDAQVNVLGGRNLYRTGLSPVPYGLSGLDYYSYPRSLLTRGGGYGSGLGQTKILSGGGFSAGDSQVSGLGDPIGQEKVTIVESTPTIIQEPTFINNGGFGQRQVTTLTSTGGLGRGLRGGQILLRGGPALGIRRVKTRPVIQESTPVFVDATSGLGAPIGGFGQRQVVTKTVAASPVVQAPVIAAPIPVRRVISRGLGESFLTQAVRPRLAARRLVSRPQLVSQPRVAIQSQQVPGNIQFTLGNTQVIGGPIQAQRPVVAVQRPAYVQRPAVQVQRPAYVQRPVVQVQRPAYVQRPVVQVQRPAYVQRPVVQVQRPVTVSQPQVISQVKTTGGFGGNRIFGRRIPQLVYVDGGNRYLGYDNLGGYRIGDPRFNYAQLPISSQRFANLGLSQGSIDAGPVLVAPAPAPALFGTKSSPVTKTVISDGGGLGLAGIGQTSPAKVVTQEEVIGPAGDRQIVTTVQDAGPSKIGGPVVGGGFAGIGQVGGTKTVTQEEVIGPAGDRQVVTTVSQSGPSKIGGPVLGGGLAGIGQTGATKTITQEEVIGPAGDSQIVTTVTKSSPSKIGGPVVGGLGLSGIGQSAPAQVVTQEEVIGPAGDRQVVTTVSNAGSSKIGGLASGGPLGLAGIGQTGGTKTITQEEVIGPSGDSQILTTVTQSGPSKIGGPVVGGSGLSGIGQAAKVVTQEEVIGPAGDSQIVTTITESAGPSKIGGVAAGSPFGLSGAGQAPTKVITQEEVIGPAGDSQVITTISESSPQNIVQQEDIGSSGFSSLTASPLSQIAQDPITSALSQESLGDNVIISSGSSGIGPVSQSSVDDFIGQSDISGGSGLAELSQQSIGSGGFSDPIVQQSISPGFGNSYGYSPRVSFLSQFPYDVPSRTLLRQAVTRPFIQDQQQLEQILV